MLQLTFNPGLTLTGFQTTRPRTLEQVALGQALAGDIVLCSWARHFTPILPLSAQVYKWVQANLMLEGNLVMRWTSIPSSGE